MIFLKVLSRPLLIPGLVGAAGLMYGAHELSFITCDALFTNVTGKSNPGRSFKCIAVSVGTAASILALRRGGGNLLQQPMKYHVNSIIASGMASGVARALVKTFT